MSDATVYLGKLVGCMTGREIVAVFEEAHEDWSPIGPDVSPFSEIIDDPHRWLGVEIPTFSWTGLRDEPTYCQGSPQMAKAQGWIIEFFSQRAAADQKLLDDTKNAAAPFLKPLADAAGWLKTLGWVLAIAAGVYIGARIWKG